MPYFACDQCPKGYSRPSLLEQHQRTHTGERPFKCDQCDAAFTRKSHRDSHTRIHNETKAITCPECGKGFHTDQHYNRHKNMHSRNFKCDQCGEGFRMELQLKRHIVRHSLVCQGCGSQYRTPALMERHISTDRVHKCRQCGHVAVCYNALNNHYKIHKEESQRPPPPSPPKQLPLPPVPIKGDIDPNLFDPTVKRPRQPTKTAIGLVSGAHIKQRTLPCPIEGCEQRSFRKYDMARHLAAVHPEHVQRDVADDLADDDDESDW